MKQQSLKSLPEEEERGGWRYLVENIQHWFENPLDSLLPVAQIKEEPFYREKGSAATDGHEIDPPNPFLLGSFSFLSLISKSLWFPSLTVKVRYTWPNTTEPVLCKPGVSDWRGRYLITGLVCNSRVFTVRIGTLSLFCDIFFNTYTSFLSFRAVFLNRTKNCNRNVMNHGSIWFDGSNMI